MRTRRILAINRPDASRWRQFAGFLLAALLGLTVPGSAFDHVDAIFSQHAHDPITRATLPLADPHGHPLRMDQSSPIFEPSFEPSLRAQTAAPVAGLLHDLMIASWLIVLAVALGATPLPITLNPRLTGRLFGPAPPPPRG